MFAEKAERRKAGRRCGAIAVLAVLAATPAGAQPGTWAEALVGVAPLSSAPSIPPGIQGPCSPSVVIPDTVLVVAPNVPDNAFILFVPSPDGSVQQRTIPPRAHPEALPFVVHSYSCRYAGEQPRAAILENAGRYILYHSGLTAPFAEFSAYRADGAADPLVWSPELRGFGAASDVARRKVVAAETAARARREEEAAAAARRTEAERAAARDVAAAARQQAAERADRAAALRRRGFSASTIRDILAERVRIGWTKATVRESWGEPEDINTTITAGSRVEQWVYGLGSYVYFRNGVVFAIQN